MVKSPSTDFGRDSFGHPLLKPSLLPSSLTASKQIPPSVSPRKVSNEFISTTRSDLSSSLKNIRHDHQTLLSPPNNMSNNLPNIYSGDMIPKSEFDAQHSCLPYGFYYDTDDMTDEGVFSKSPVFDMMDDELMMITSDSDDFYSLNGVNPSSSPPKDFGPTLAQLNLSDGGQTDDVDFDYFVLPPPPADRSFKRQLSTQEISRPVKQMTLESNRPEKKSQDNHSIAYLVMDHMRGLSEVKFINGVDSSMKTVIKEDPDGKASPLKIKREDVVKREYIQPEVTSVPVETMSKPVKMETPSSLKVKSEPPSSPVPSSSKVRPEVSRVRNTSEGSVSSHDEGFASQPEDSDEDDDSDHDSDDESFYGDYEAKDLLGASTSDDKNNKWALNMGRTRKGGQQRFFWQYNVQSKGPKGIRIPSVADAVDPHVLSEASDPVFSPECRVEGVKHAGKARRGDGNDLTPNPRKLLMIGLELKKLSKTINDLTPVADVPVTARNKTRKEKNKLASRACRLKKKAQHEANKIKLFGLNQEHKKTIAVMAHIKKLVRKRLETRNSSPLTPYLQEVVKDKKGNPCVAGRTADFVNSILDKVAEGVADGGLSNL